MRILTLCGSLRKQSSNRAILQAYEELSPAAMIYRHYDRAGLLPHFNPDLDQDPLPAEVSTLRAQVAGADLLLISTPEYVHALPGSFKNVLDWLVSDVSFAGKPVVILQVSKGSSFAHDSLKEVLRTMSAKLLEKSSSLLPLSTNQANPQSLLQEPELRKLLAESIRCLQEEFDPGPE